MTVVGIIAEFNPFHKGHEYIISEAKRLTGADYCVIVMSGDFVQRGTPAVCDKFMRAKMALSGGADAVFELPVPFATASAEIFAEAGVRLLTSLGCVDYIVFGSECGDTQMLMKCASVLVSEPPEYKEVLNHELKCGASFPAAREAALRSLDGGDELAAAVTSPNNILGIEYCKAVLRLTDRFSVTQSDNRYFSATNSCNNAPFPAKTESSAALRIPAPLAIKRVGSGYNDTSVSDSDFASASAVRHILEGAVNLQSEGLCRAALGNAASGKPQPFRLSPLNDDSPVSHTIAAASDIDTYHYFTAASDIDTYRFFTAASDIDTYRFFTAASDAPGIFAPSVIGDVLPEYSASALLDGFGKCLPITADALSDMLHVRLATISDEELFATADITRDLGNAIRNLSNPVPAASFSQICEQLKTKNTTYSSVSRALLHIVLGIDNSFTSRMRSESLPFPYVRLLGFKTGSSALLRAVSDCPCCTLITKLADARTLFERGSLAADIFNAGLRAGGIYGQLVRSRFGSDSVSEFKIRPVQL